MGGAAPHPQPPLPVGSGGRHQLAAGAATLPRLHPPCLTPPGGRPAPPRAGRDGGKDPSPQRQRPITIRYHTQRRCDGVEERGLERLSVQYATALRGLNDWFISQKKRRRKHPEVRP